MTLQPGQETTLSVQYSMHQGMGGPHRFGITVPSNDPVQPKLTLYALASYPKP
ncbi:MAG TPA: hypothetical protein VFU72_03135 [Nitrolancea sp.]|nr:hypothetical protein [Nitrolancea sp.]